MDRQNITTTLRSADISPARLLWLAATGLVFAAGLVFALGGGSSQAAAGSGLTFRGEEMTLVVPTDEGDGYVRIHLLLADDGSGSFDEIVADARADALAGFPGAVVLKAGQVSAAYSTFTSWNPPTANWSYNDAGKPAGLTGDAGAIAGAANSWNGVGGSSWSFTGGGATGLSPNACVNGGGDGNNVVGWSAIPLDGSVLARTCTWFGSFASEFDMVYSPTWNWTTGSPVQTDLYTVAVHEFGHALGLLHTQGSNCPGASLCETYSVGSTLAGPQADDINGVVSLYGGVGSTPAPGGPPPAPGSAVDHSPPPPPAAPTKTPEPQAFFLPGVARD